MAGALEVSQQTKVDSYDLATASPGAEIDPQKPLGHFRPRPVQNQIEEGADFSLECAVDWIPSDERNLMLIDACPVCGSEWAEPRFQIASIRLRLVECTECGLGRLHPRPSPELISRFYPPSYYGITGAKFLPFVEKFIRLVAARRVRWLSRNLPRGARVLDVGCGRGILLGALADRGFEVHGFEINEAAAAGADPRARICVGPNLAAVRYPDASFDQVIVWHVLEHLPDPRETLVEIRRILKPGGRIVVSVPNFNSLQARWAGPAWFHLDLPRHIYHFNARGLQSLLADCGFTCRRAHHFSIRQNPFGWLQSALNRLPGSRRNALYTLLKVGQKSASPDLCPATQTLLKLAYWLGMPIAGALSVAEAILRRGGSVCVTANTTDDVRGCH